MQEMRTPRTGVLEALLRLERSREVPSREALERARQIARFIEQHKSPVPFVFPTEIGGIQFEWRGKPREVDLEVLPQGTALAFSTLVDGKCSREGEIKEDVEREVRNLLRWMVGL